MANLIAIKRRIKAAQNVSKTTKAMQMIAASKFKKAQDATLAGRPYVKKLTELQESVLSKVTNTSKFPYLNPKSELDKTLIIVLSPDKGLCGSLVTNLLKEFMALDSKNKPTYIVVGKKMQSKATSLSKEVIASFEFGNSLPTFDIVYPIRHLIDQYYLEGKVSQVKVLYTDFTSIFSQKPVVADLLPIKPGSITSDSEYKFEPGQDKLLPELMSHFIEMNIYQYILESYASEQSSRMISMKNATDNANDIIEDLKLEYNKGRQAKITSELLDITSGMVN